jgi:hypothetical protein
MDKKRKKLYPKQWVKCGDFGWVDMNDTEFIDIEECRYGSGRDVVTVEYEGETFKSYIAVGSKPG